MWRLTVLALISAAAAQIPSLGWCPDYLPMANFNMKRFLGTWYEVERYFTVSEIVSRCVTTKYDSTPEGRILVSNEITNSLTGLKRVMDGHVQVIGREGEGRIIVKYAALPIPYDTEYSILDTDYDNWAVLWSCSGIGPVHTQNAWVMTRERLPNMQILQAAYGVLDRYKISRTFFVKTPQADCTILPNPAADVESKNANPVVHVDEKSVGIPDVVDKVIEVSPEKHVVDPVVAIKPNVPEERSALNEKPEASKPMQVPELILESAEKKEEKMEKPEAMPPKPEKPEKDMPLKSDLLPEASSSVESKEKESAEKLQ